VTLTCGEESSLSIHGGNDARFARFRQWLLGAEPLITASLAAASSAQGKSRPALALVA
jgi:hypothetical protein